MLRVGEASSAGIADQVAYLEWVLQSLQEELMRVRHSVVQLEARLRVLEEQNEAWPWPEQERRDVDVDVGDGYRVCQNRCGREFRIHPHHPQEQFCCSDCRKNKGHSTRCAQRSRLSGAAAASGLG